MPIAPKTLADRALALLREDVLAGRLAPDTRLKLTQLQRHYALGLSPIREALMRLAVEGHVVAEGQKGFRVAPISPQDLADLMQARRHIERAALASAMEQGDEEWEAAVLSAFHLLSRAPVPGDARDPAAAALWEERHRAFHQALVGACSSKWLLRMQAQLMDHSERYRRVRMFHSVPSRQIARDVQAEHRALMEATLARDTSRATALLLEHLDRTAEAVGRYWRAAPKPPAASPPTRRATSRRARRS